MTFKDAPIRRKLMTIVLLTSGAVLFLTCTSFFAYEFVTFRQGTVRQLSTLGQIIAANSTAALAFQNPDDAEEILSALKAEEHIVAASLYGTDGKLFSIYPAGLSRDAVPAAPETDGYRFAHSHLIGFQPVVQGNNKRLGTLYLKSDMGAMYDRFQLYGGIAFLVIVGSFLVAYFISRILQRQISQPIMALAETAKSVSDRHDYSVRASKMGEDELGLLTDAFNHMLTQIQGQTLALSESETRVRAVLNSALSAVFVIDAEGRIVDWNTRAEIIFGWTRREALGLDLAETILPPGYRKTHRRGIERFLATGEGPVINRPIELSALRRDGSEFPVEFSISPLKSGDVVTFCGFITDITERKQAEEAVRQSEGRYRTLFDTLIEGFCTIEMVFDAGGKPVDYRFLEINPAFERQTGLNDVQGRLMRDIAPDHEAHWFDAFGKIALTGEPLHFENEAKALGRHYDVHAYRVGGPESRKVAILFNDITERKRSEARLHAQLGRLDLLSRITRAIGERQDLPSILQVVVRSLEEDLPLDFSCVCLYEPAQESLIVASVGVKSEVFAMELAMPEKARIPIDANGLSRCVGGQLVYEPDVSHSHFPFPQRLLRGGLHAFVAAPLLVENKVFGVLIAARRGKESFTSPDCEFIRQLSEHVALAAHQVQINSALQQAYNDLRQSQHTIMQQERLRALGQMASGIAHDINNAISPVALYTESLLEREPNLSERTRNYLVTIQRAIEDVAETVSRMREFYRQREPQLVLAPVHLSRLVQQAVDLTRARWSDVPQQQGVVIDLKTDLAADLPAIMGAEGEIRDALTNLIFNAVDAMPQGGTLTLRTCSVSPRDSNSAELVHLEVTDTGTGMDEETKRKCLEPFFTTKGERGTGLGLAMVYGMIQRHSADMEIDSAVGKGTTMRLVFPVTVPVLSSTVRPSSPALPFQRLRLLLVDDDPLLIKSLRDTLEAEGHLITAADGGLAGIKAFVAAQGRGEPFEAVITDLGMPHVDGRKVSEAVKNASPNTPVIMLTGWGQRMIAENDIPPHVDRVLSKPPKLQPLRLALSELTAQANQTAKQP